MRRVGWAVIVCGLLAVPGAGQDRQGPALYDPYERPKNGPPLAGIFHKARPEWIQTKLRDPRHHPAARMPEMRLSDEDVLDVMAYLSSVAGPAPAPREWPAWASTAFDDLDEEAFDAVTDLVEHGRAVWGNARCTICHTVAASGRGLVGGFVDLRVGGVDLQDVGTKLARDWLYQWLQDPKTYFPDTLMPRFTFSDRDIRGLVEYILRDDAFRAAGADSVGASAARSAVERALGESARAARGRRLVELSRCVVCHDVPGIPDVLPAPERPAPPPPGTFAWDAWDRRCLTCHRIEGRGGTYAPDLTGEGSRLRAEWVADFVASPDMVRPLSQQMPKLGLTPEEARRVAAYMAAERRDSRVPEGLPGGAPTAEEVRRGQAAFRARGCHACHADGAGPGGVVGPDLTRAGERLTPGYIWFHLKYPHAVNPDAAEPEYGLSDADARDLAAWVASRRR